MEMKILLYPIVVLSLSGSAFAQQAASPPVDGVPPIIRVLQEQRNAALDAAADAEAQLRNVQKDLAALQARIPKESTPTAPKDAPMQPNK